MSFSSTASDVAKLGNAHDLAAARETVLPVLRNYTGQIPGLADCGYEGAGHGFFTASPSEIGLITRAALVLTLFEHKRLT
jgi:hypothetical protein